MDHHHQHQLARPGREQPGPDRHLRRQVEGVTRRLRHRGVEIGRRLPDRLPCQLVRGQDPLVGLAVGDGEDGPQHLVPLDHVAQGAAEGIPVDVAGQAQHDRVVVGAARPLKLADEPQPLLRERQRHPFRAFHRRQRRLDGAV